MLSNMDLVVREALKLASKSQAPHIVFTSIFLGQSAVEEIMDALDQNEIRPRVTFCCLYFGNQ